MEQLRTLKVGSRGELVSVWQAFLKGRNLYAGRVDGVFGSNTKAATQLYEDSVDVLADGVVDGELWGCALEDGLALPGLWGHRGKPPPKPTPGVPLVLNTATKHALFGRLLYTPAPTAADSDAVKCTNGWQKDWLIEIQVPELSGMLGAPKGNLILVNKRAAKPIQLLFAAWARSGLIQHIKSWAGCWSMRTMRGKPNVLSSHAWGTAFDINSPWNPLGGVPAGWDKTGTVFPLVEDAVAHGFTWGGFWPHPDGMHFELLIPV